MEQVRSLAGTSLDELYVAWEDAFSDYERTWTHAEFEQTLKRRGYLPALSFGAFDEGRLLSFTVNGIGLYNGAKTAYDAGTGTIKEYRRRGLAGRIFDASVPFLRQEGIAQYLLEVLRHNPAAVGIYTKAGFGISRHFDYFVQSMNEVKLNTKALPEQYKLQEIDLSKKDEMAQMWDFIPSWQNSFDSIQRSIVDFKIVGAFDGDRLMGYGITDPGSGDITQIAVGKVYRRQGIGSGILKELLNCNRHASVKLINIESACTGMLAFIENNGIFKRGSQFEMIKHIG